MEIENATSAFEKLVEMTYKMREMLAGQNPWSDGMSEFQRHLSELSQDSMHKALLRGQKAQELNPETTVYE